MTKGLTRGLMMPVINISLTTFQSLPFGNGDIYMALYLEFEHLLSALLHDIVSYVKADFEGPKRCLDIYLNHPI